MKMFKKIMLSMLIASSVRATTLAMESSTTNSMEQNLEASSFLREITFTNWLNKLEDASTQLKISQLFHNALSRQLVNNAITMHFILKSYNLLTLGCQLEWVKSECSERIEIINRMGGLKIDEVSWLKDEETIIAIEPYVDFKKIKEVIKKMQSKGMFKEDDSLQLINSHIKIIFLGGCIDHTETEPFPWGDVDPIDGRVFATAALLALKNPGQVLMSTSLLHWLQTEDEVNKLYPQSKKLEPIANLEGERCSFCWVPLNEINGDLVVLPCGHVICGDDFNTLEQANMPCPICGGPLRQ